MDILVLLLHVVCTYSTILKKPNYQVWASDNKTDLFAAW